MSGGKGSISDPWLPTNLSTGDEWRERFDFVGAPPSRRMPGQPLIGETHTVLSFRIDDRRSLRLYEEADAEELYDVTVANRAYLARWMPWAADQKLEGTREFIRTSRRQLAENQGFQLAITVDGKIVGGLGFHRLDWENGSTSIGYWIAEDAQGHGTVTEAVRALVNHAFGTWKLGRVEIRAGVQNLRSRAIPERLGFVNEGVLRRAERVGDRFIDHVVYAMLAEDWPADSR